MESYDKTDLTPKHEVMEEEPVKDNIMNLRQLASNAKLPLQVVECLIQCGYESIDVVADLEDVKPIEAFLRENHFLFEESQKRHMYGIYASVPEKFSFLPAHATSLMNFVDTCAELVNPAAKKHDTRGKRKTQVEEYAPERRSGAKRRYKEPSLSPIPESSSQASDNKILELDVYRDMKQKFTYWCAKHDHEDIKNLIFGKHYKITVKQQIPPVYQRSSRQRAIQIQGFLICNICSTEIRLQYRLNSLSISNGTRHLSNCVRNPFRKAKLMNKNILHPSDETTEAVSYEKNLLDPSDETSEAVSYEKNLLDPSDETSEAVSYEKNLLDPSDETSEAVSYEKAIDYEGDDKDATQSNQPTIEQDVDQEATVVG